MEYGAGKQRQHYHQATRSGRMGDRLSDSQKSPFSRAKTAMVLHPCRVVHYCAERDHGIGGVQDLVLSGNAKIVAKRHPVWVWQPIALQNPERMAGEYQRGSERETRDQRGGVCWIL